VPEAWETRGGALRDEEPEAPAEAAEEPVPNDGHLCPGCAHASVCQIAAAILFAGGEGQVTISRCGEFVPEAALSDVREAAAKEADAVASEYWSRAKGGDDDEAALSNEAAAMAAEKIARRIRGGQRAASESTAPQK
jgi:hypothetical protein